MKGGGGFEPPKLSQQIYSLPHLATLELPQRRAEEGTRTPDQLITNQLLYQLSYLGLLSFEKLRTVFFGMAKVKEIFIYQNFRADFIPKIKLKIKIVYNSCF